MGRLAESAYVLDGTSDNTAAAQPLETSVDRLLIHARGRRKWVSFSMDRHQPSTPLELAAHALSTGSLRGNKPLMATNSEACTPSRPINLRILLR